MLKGHESIGWERRGYKADAVLDEIQRQFFIKTERMKERHTAKQRALTRSRLLATSPNPLSDPS
jgi:hypothetical protein